ncbi:MAG: hypothetical protein NC115_03110 [Bacteroidales bacterium]|nr:hypothetical protein [Bacteroides sp.]MCM1198060.1 hypothetical protein [Clostridium sp.]MCM1501644.1 hypothetical protein [Bacteroidales bacterium]
MKHGNPMDSTKDYMEMKADGLKLKATESLSLVFSKFLSLFVIIMVLMIVLVTIAFGGVLLLGDIIGSYAAGAFIVAGVFLIALIVLICLRKKLFLNSFVQLFIQIFYGDK